MHTIYQSLKFEKTWIDFNKPDGVLNTILTPCFKPGKHVRSLCLYHLPAPADPNMIEPANDPLYPLIKHTPQVKHVSFTVDSNTKE